MWDRCLFGVNCTCNFVKKMWVSQVKTFTLKCEMKGSENVDRWETSFILPKCLFGVNCIYNFWKKMWVSQVKSFILKREMKGRENVDRWQTKFYFIKIVPNNTSRGPGKISNSLYTDSTFHHSNSNILTFLPY